MACFLSFTDVELECSGCCRPVRPGLIGMTDELGPAPLAPICPCCLNGLDRRLFGAQRIVAAARELLDVEQADPVAARDAAREP